MVSRDKAWFDYLIKREESEDFRFALKTLDSRSGQLIVDIGCGIGQLIGKIDRKAQDKKMLIGFDKSILSLLIAKIYIKRADVLLVLTDIEQGVPLRSAIADNAVLLNSLPWIYNKKRICGETARVLKKDGQLSIFNIFSPDGEAKTWGDGIRQDKLKQILKESFRNIRFMKFKETDRGYVSKYGYNVFAKKIRSHLLIT